MYLKYAAIFCYFAERIASTSFEQRRPTATEDARKSNSRAAGKTRANHRHGKTRVFVVAYITSLELQSRKIDGFDSKINTVHMYVFMTRESL